MGAFRPDMFVPMTESAQDDTERFRSVYEANWRPLLSYALRRAASSDDAADVVAETLLIAWRRLEGLPDGDEARLWLFGVARKVLANQRRGNVRRERLGERLRKELRDLPVTDPVVDGEGAAAVAFARLSPEDRDILGLVAWEGLTAAELARVFDCSPNAARIRLHRARKRFVAELAHDGIALKQVRTPGQERGEDPSPDLMIEETT